MDSKKISELANLLRNNGDKILNSEFTLTLSGSLLRALNDSFTLIADSLDVGEVEKFQVVKPMNSKRPVFRDLQLIHDFVQKTTLLCLVEYPGDDYNGPIDISKFRTLKRLEVQKLNIKQIVGIQRLRSQLQHVVCVKSIKNVGDIITNCGGDNSNGFVWNELKIADFSYNNLIHVDTSLEFAQYLQHLNLRHNKLVSVEAVKWLPQLKSLDVSFNRLTHIPQFHMDAYKRLLSLNMSNNLVESIRDVVKLNALTDLDLSDNLLLNHCDLLPLRSLMTLKYLNLYGNPLYCHPKHRMVTAKYLPKNCSSVRFVLDNVPLSKSEKTATGSTKLDISKFMFRSYLSTPSTQTTSWRHSRTETPSSSVGSLVSFALPSDNSSDSSEHYVNIQQSKKKSSTRARCAEIEEEKHIEDKTEDHKISVDVMNTSITSQIISDSTDAEHLETRRQVVELREKYGNDWLYSGIVKMRQSQIGNSPNSCRDMEEELQKSRDMFREFIKYENSDNSENSVTPNNNTMMTSTPTNNTLDNTFDQLITSPIKKIENENDNTLYKSMDQTQPSKDGNTTKSDEENTLYKSLDDTGVVKNTNPFEECVDNEKLIKGASDGENELKEEKDIFKYVYSSTENDEPEVSEREDDEETYFVYPPNNSEAIFLTISSNFLRERDPFTEKTKAKWSLKILKSCESIKLNTLRLTFDTVRTEKQERVYVVEEDSCQELEKKLRDVLPKPSLNDQIIYRCVNCYCQFSRNFKIKNTKMEIECPKCKSNFVTEIQDKNNKLEKLSPASIVEEIVKPLSVSEASPAEIADDSNSIGKGITRLKAPQQATTTTTLKQRSKRSANSLNASSSCSKIESNLESSFNSNQSLIGSSNSNRDINFKTNGESDVDIISNPSQSSIEVLEHYSSRKTSEERRIAHIPNLETIDDQSYTQTFLEREFENMINFAKKDKSDELEPKEKSEEKKLAHEHMQQNGKRMTKNTQRNHLTESSSSGSVTDSVCTAYEQKENVGANANKDGKLASKDFVQNELNGNVATNMEKNDGNGVGPTSMFSAFMQSTNMLMSSSKKFLESETLSNIKSGTPLPQLTTIHPTTSIDNNSTTSSADSNSATSDKSRLYKFSFSDFNDIDHRLKLYFYQTKFEDRDEHFKWIVKGRIYIEATKQLMEGCVVVSTCKLYVMEAFAPENEDVSKWLRPLTIRSVDSLEEIQLLPWKIGLSFYLRDWGGFLLLLQDILRTDSLMLYFANNGLPSMCDLIYQPNELITKRLNSAVMDEKLLMCSILNGCEITCENAKRSFAVCCLLATDSHLYVSSQKLDWLSIGGNDEAIIDCANNIDAELELCITQFMSNLVEVEQSAHNIFIIKFLDETQDKYENWKCTFETTENASTCLNAIAQSWEKLFGVPLFNS